jgi:signal transduction histidine kinase
MSASLAEAEPRQIRRDRRLRIAAMTLAALIVLGAASRALFDVLNGHVKSELESGGVLDLLLMTFPATGLVLALNRPRDALGWLLLAVGSAFVATPGAPYARYAAVTRDGELPGAGLALAIESPMWVVFIGLSGFLLLLFPDGHLPSPRWRLRWLTWAAGVIAFAYVTAFVPQVLLGSEGEAWGSLLGTIAVMTFLLIPVTIGIAVLRYRLYDIDFVIKKTVVVAVLVAFIAAVYAAIVVGVGALVGSGAGDPLLSAVAAAIVALAFQPLRARARRLADRVVYGRRATPYEVLGEFGGQLAGTYSAADVLPRIARVLAEGVGAEGARVWLRVGDALRVVATWPIDRADDDDDDVTVEVRHQGEALGALSVTMPANDPIDPAKEQLVHHERNIHDGAQQQLVALQVRQGLAEQMVDRDPARAKELLAQLQADTTTALADLRDLARGIYPPLLADKGLATALEAQARKSSVPVTVESDGIGRYAQEGEAAVHFSVLEALQNVAKYAHASQVTVHLSEQGGHVAFTVADDGTGFDPARTGYGTGLQGIADRLGALDGTLEVVSAPDDGTIVAGRLPVVSVPPRMTEAVT